jgi:ribonuclease P protein component
MLPRTHRLTQSRAFQALYRRGRRWEHALAVLHLLPRAAGDIRFGVVVGKKVGGSVQRNRVRRLFREALRGCLPEIRRGVHGVWVARPAAADASFGDVERAVRDLMERARLFQAETASSEQDPAVAFRNAPHGRPAQGTKSRS